MLKLAIVLGGLLLFSQATEAEKYALTLDVTTCLERHTPSETYVRFNRVSLRVNRTQKLDAPYFFVHGALGWHLTWGVLFDISADPVKAYETYGSKGDITGTIGRMPVPFSISSTLEKCGYQWAGLWEHDWPEAALKQNAPPKALMDLPLSDLMPPLVKTPDPDPE